MTKDEDIRKRLEIGDKDLEMWMERIRPVVRFDVQGYHEPMVATRPNPVGIPFWIEIPDPRSVAFTWQPKPTKSAMNLRQAGHIITYHSFGAPSLFKPSIAEVLAQLRHAEQKGAIDLFGVIAFETGNGELTSTNVFSTGEGSWHWCSTILYRDYAR